MLKLNAVAIITVATVIFNIIHSNNTVKYNVSVIIESSRCAQMFSANSLSECGREMM